jgi:TM2 domain-containing membrane protein YozV
MVDWILNPKKQVDNGMALLILIFNVVPLLPGLGTIIYGRTLRGLLEIVTGWLVIGYVFAIIDGVQIYTKTVNGKPALTPTSS